MLKIVWYYCPWKYLPEGLISSVLAHHLDHQIAEMNFHLQFSPFFPNKYEFLITNSDSTSKITSELQKKILAIDHLEWFNCDFVKNCNMQMRFLSKKFQICFNLYSLDRGCIITLNAIITLWFYTIQHWN